MARIVRFHELGGPDKLVIEEVNPPPPGEGEVSLRVEAFGLNRSEAQMRVGNYPMIDASLPSKLGKEAVGIIESIGAGVKGFKVGERVSTVPCFDMAKYGVYGEVATVPAFSLARLPENLSIEERAAIWQQYLTVYAPFAEYANLMPGDFVLVTAATSSVGNAAIQFAKLFNTQCIAITRSKAKKAGLSALGADYVIALEEDDLVERVNEITGGQGVTMVFDCVSGKIVQQLADCCAKFGTVVLYGKLADEQTQFPLITAMKKALSFRGYTLWEIVEDAAMFERAKSFICRQLEAGNIKPNIDRVFDFDDVVKAHEYLESNKQTGKIVVRVS